MVAGGAITRSTASIEPHPEVRGAKEASASPRAAPGGGWHDLGGAVRAGRHDLGGASASTVWELPPDAALASPPCRAAAEVGAALAAARSLVPATPRSSRPPSQPFAGRLPWEVASQAAAAVGWGVGGSPPARQGCGAPSTGSATPAYMLCEGLADLAHGAHVPPPVAPQSSTPDHRGGQRGGEAARPLPGEWLGPPLPREAAGRVAGEAHTAHAAQAAHAAHVAHAAAAQHASAAIAEARAIELRAALDAMEAAVISAHGAAGAGATLGSSPRAAAAGGAGGGAVDGEAVAHQLVRLRRRAALCSELVVRQRLLAHALHTDGGGGGGGSDGDGGGQVRAATAEERATAVVQIEAELAAWERLALPLPPPRWAEPAAAGRLPLAQEPTAAAVPLAAAAAAAAVAAARVAPSAREAAAAAVAAADAVMASSPARAAPMTTAAASSVGTAAAAAGVISQMRAEQQGKRAVLAVPQLASWPPGTHGFGPWLLHALKRRASAAQTPVGGL